MGILDIVVLGLGGFFLLKNSGNGSTSGTGVKSVLAKIPVIGGWFSENPLLEKTRLWQELNDKSTDEQKVVLAKLWPLLNQEKVS